MSALAAVARAAAGGAAPARRAAATYPFAVGETLTYSAKLGMLTLGSGTLEVAAIDTVRGDEASGSASGSQGKTIVLLAGRRAGVVGRRRRLRLAALRAGFRRERQAEAPTYEIYPDSGFYREKGQDTDAQPTPAEPLDDAAFFYFVRVTPLEVGKKYIYNRYFRKDKNPVTIEVIKREKMELPDGREVHCLVLHPVIDTKGMFSKRSDTRIWLTDDARRLPVQIRSKFPFGTITLRLKEMRAARP